MATAFLFSIPTPERHVLQFSPWPCHPSCLPADPICPVCVAAEQLEKPGGPRRQQAPTLPGTAAARGAPARCPDPPTPAPRTPSWSLLQALAFQRRGLLAPLHLRKAARGRKAKKLPGKGVVPAGPGFFPAADPACSPKKRVLGGLEGEAGRQDCPKVVVVVGCLPVAQAGMKQALSLRQTQALCKNTRGCRRPESHKHAKSPALPGCEEQPQRCSAQGSGACGTATFAGPGRGCECGNRPTRLPSATACLPRG